MGFSAVHRAALCDALECVGPDAPTLCEGWTTSELAAHLWVRENDPTAAPGLILPRFASATQDRMTAALERWSYVGLVDLIRQGPPAGSLFGLPGVDEQANVAEYFVHGEDVRRANGLPPYPCDAAFEDWVWGRLAALSRFLYRKALPGVTLERAAGATAGQRVVARPGSSMVTLIGAPSELLLFSFGRTQDAVVRLVGTKDSSDWLLKHHAGF